MKTRKNENIQVLFFLPIWKTDTYLVALLIEASRLSTPIAFPHKRTTNQLYCVGLPNFVVCRLLPYSSIPPRMACLIHVTPLLPSFSYASSYCTGKVCMEVLPTYVIVLKRILAHIKHHFLWHVERNSRGGRGATIWYCRILKSSHTWYTIWYLKVIAQFYHNRTTGIIGWTHNLSYIERGCFGFHGVGESIPFFPRRDFVAMAMQDAYLSACRQKPNESRQVVPTLGIVNNTVGIKRMRKKQECCDELVPLIIFYSQCLFQGFARCQEWFVHHRFF